MRYHPFAHAGLKLASLALAVLLWTMVSSQRELVERGVRVPLELQNLPDYLEMVEPPPESVDVRVRGTADVLGRLVPGEVVATIDLDAAQPGRRLFHLSPERVKAPFAVEVTQVNPSSVAIRFEPSATRIVPVQPSVEGQPAPGYIVGKVSANPPTVEVIGPESVLRRVTEAISEPILVEAATADVRATVVLGVADEGVRLKSAKTAVVNVSIIAAPEERRLSNVPVRVRNLARGLTARVTPPAVQLRVQGTKAVIEPITDRSIVAYVDLERIGPGDYGLPVRLEPVPDVGIDQLEPAIVSIHVQ